MWYKAWSYSTLFMPPPARPNIELCLLTASFIQCHTKETCPLFKNWCEPAFDEMQDTKHIASLNHSYQTTFINCNKKLKTMTMTHLVTLWHCWNFVKRNRETQIMTTTRVIWHSESDTGQPPNSCNIFIDCKKNIFVDSKVVVDSVSLTSWLHMWARMCKVPHPPVLLIMLIVIIIK